MGTRFLIDTNILIYYFTAKIPDEEIDTINGIFQNSFIISIVSKIEFLGWKNHTTEGFFKSREFIKAATVIQINDAIGDTAIDLRRSRNIKLPDAVIAATAIRKKSVLVTRNANDFKDIEKLEIYNPFQPK